MYCLFYTVRFVYGCKYILNSTFVYIGYIFRAVRFVHIEIRKDEKILYEIKYWKIFNIYIEKKL